MKDLQIFKNEKFGQVRVVEIDNEPWFVGKDIVKALSYDLTTGTSYTQYIKKYCNQEDIKNYNKETQVQYTLEFDYKKLGQRGGLLINEYALYDLALESPLPSAKEFKKWVTHEVLPSIRKHGVYMTDDILERTLADPDFMINLLTNLKEEKEKRRLAEGRTKRLIHNSRTYTATEIAKELGFKSAKTFNKDLENKKIQYKVNGVWVLSADYSDKDYVSIKQQELDNGTVIYNRRWTGLGREWLLNEIYGYDK